MPYLDTDDNDEGWIYYPPDSLPFWSDDPSYYEDSIKWELHDIASSNYIGMMDPLYALASSGSIVPGLIDSARNKIKRFPDVDNTDLETLIQILTTVLGVKEDEEDE